MPEQQNLILLTYLAKHCIAAIVITGGIVVMIISISLQVVSWAFQFSVVKLIGCVFSEHFQKHP